MKGSTGTSTPGATVTVVSGETRWTRWINPSSSYLCSNDPRAHFGLGEKTTIDAILVKWPDGTEEKFATAADGIVRMAVDRFVEIRKGMGKK